jgi:hypothetical protein
MILFSQFLAEGSAHDDSADMGRSREMGLAALSAGRGNVCRQRKP